MLGVTRCPSQPQELVTMTRLAPGLSSGPSSRHTLLVPQ